ncbi:oxalate decarboxylase [Pyrrhoderma noxium]|uniref:Oxalate decarboxylase n=1 Tax=Pyrrhoderma noxium TaxID=2282107 RepID=A0A286UA43_9AGAM|nr:oxalate decarboxylase [Pyrrhoderma noxium]
MQHILTAENDIIFLDRLASLEGRMKTSHSRSDKFNFTERDNNMRFRSPLGFAVSLAMFNSRFLHFLLLASSTLAAPAASSGSTSESVDTSSVLTSSSALASSSLTSSINPSETSSGSGSGVSSAPSEEQTVAPASDDPNEQIFPPGFDGTPEAIRGQLGASIISPDDTLLDQQNPDFLAPPSTDHGSTGNAKWPFAFSHNRLQTGGWARQQNLDVMPIATAMASVNMRLLPGAVRELHWHKTAEWAYVLKGSTIVTAINPDGQVFIDTVNAGDLWYFPAGFPHSLQATDDDPDGTEFILVFDDGSFSEDSTLLLTDWAAHIPKEVLAKNFHTNISAFDHIPSEELYIFPSTVTPKSEQNIQSPAGNVPSPFTYKLSQAPATPLAGGSMKIFDPSVFPIATTIVGALVTVEPGAMRELHWHPTEPEWSYFIAGTARMTLFAGQSNARTFDFQVGDIGYVPPSLGHYVENTGNTTMVFLELFNSDKVQDVSLEQWLALTPPSLVKAHLGLDDETIASLNKTKQFVVAPSNPT